MWSDLQDIFNEELMGVGDWLWSGKKRKVLRVTV